MKQLLAGVTEEMHSVYVLIALFAGADDLHKMCELPCWATTGNLALWPRRFASAETSLPDSSQFENLFDYLT